MMRKDPETYFPEIAGEGIPEARNPILLTDDYWQRRDIRRQIKRNPQWLMAVSSQMATEGISLQQAIDNETENVVQGLPSLCNKNIGPKEYREMLIKQTEQKIWYNKEWINLLKQQALEKGIPLEEWVYTNAAFTVDTKIHDGEIVLPEPIEDQQIDTTKRN